MTERRRRPRARKRGATVESAHEMWLQRIAAAGPAGEAAVGGKSAWEKYQARAWKPGYNVLRRTESLTHIETLMVLDELLRPWG